MGLNKERLVNDKAPCCEHGMIATSAVCNSFKPDIPELLSKEGYIEPLLALSKLVSFVDSKDLDLLAAVIQNEKRTRRYGMKFGQRVYVRYRGLAGANYMSNFMSAFVLDARKNYVRVRSRDGSITMSFDCQTGLKGPAVYSREYFEPLLETMQKKGNIVDPDIRAFAQKRIKSIELYELGLAEQSLTGEIPTIDTVFKENKIRDKKFNDLTDIARDIDRGLNPGRTGTTSYRTKRKSKDESLTIG